MDDYHVLATKDQSGLNTGIFFVHVHQWSIQMLLHALGKPIFHPDVDLGFSADQKAMEMYFNETDSKDHILYQPRTWYNAYEFHHAYEGQAGDLLVHFPGLFEDRDTHMKKWLEVVEGPTAQEWQVLYQLSAYPARIDEFWRLLRNGRRRLEDAPALLAGASRTEDARAVIDYLRGVLHDETDQIDTMKNAMDLFDRYFHEHNFTG